MKFLLALCSLLAAAVLSSPTRSKGSLSTVAPSVDPPYMMKAPRVAMSNSVACGDSKDVGGVQERSTACGEHEGKDEKRKRAMVCGGFEDGNGNGKRSMACGEYPGWTEGRGGDIPTIQVDAPVMVTVTSTMTISCLKPTAIA